MSTLLPRPYLVELDPFDIGISSTPCPRVSALRICSLSKPAYVPTSRSCLYTGSNRTPDNTTLVKPTVLYVRVVRLHALRTINSLRTLMPANWFHFPLSRIMSSLEPFFSKPTSFHYSAMNILIASSCAQPLALRLNSPTTLRGQHTRSIQAHISA